MGVQATVEANKALERRFFDASTRADLEGMRFCWASDAVNHGGAVEGKTLPAGFSQGIEGLWLVFESLQTAFPDRPWEIIDLIGEGDRVVARLRVSGTHRGVPAVPVEGGVRLQRIIPTARPYTIQHIHIMRIADGKIAEHWATRDDLGLLNQLGGLDPV